MKKRYITPDSREMLFAGSIVLDSVSVSGGISDDEWNGGANSRENDVWMEDPAEKFRMDVWADIK